MIFDKIFKNEKGEYIDIFDVLLNKDNDKDFLYTIAEAKAINLIAKTIAKTELLIYAKNPETKKIEETVDNMYWTLNIQPNYNENGTEFLYKLALKLLVKKEALVIVNEIRDTKLLYIADSFDVSEDILKGKKFDNIILQDSKSNTISIKKSYNQNNAIYLKNQNTNMEIGKESFKKNMSKFTKVIVNQYIKSNSQKWRLKRPGSQPTLQDAETGEPITYEKYKEKITEGIFKDEDAIIMLAEAFDLINLNKDNIKNLTDFKDLFKLIGDQVASEYNIPLDIYYGIKTEKSTSNNDFITFAVDFYYEEIEDGINMVLVGKESFLNGEKVLFNRFSIFHRDILESANGIDKLTADGFSRNEVNKFLKLPKIDDDWANVHYITKNYENVEGGAEGNGE